MRELQTGHYKAKIIDGIVVAVVIEDPKGEILPP